jgi:gamma-glutamylputrescine oxidase
MGARDIFTGDMSTTPYWWGDAPPEAADGEALPERIDVAIVGGGYCGLAAALTLARAGTRVAVLEAGPLGHGASTRNGGMVGGAIKLDWGHLAERRGAAGEALLDAARASFDHLERLIRDEMLDADYCRTGRLALACNPRQFERLQHHVERLGERASGVRILSRTQLSEEIASDAFHGGAVIETSGALHPARYHRALRQAARAAGAALHGGAEVRRLRRSHARTTLETDRGRIVAEEVIIATNGYTGPITPEIRRRVVPVTSYMIATEPLPDGLADQLSPRGRMFVDENRLLAYFRLSPDRRRVLFGGRVRWRDIDERTSARALHRRMTHIWPQLRDVLISHSWKGRLGFTFDRLPHLGVLDGCHFGVGCNGSGVAMATFLGHHLGMKLLGGDAARCAFDGPAFPGHALYRHRPWFLPLVGGWYRVADAADGWWPRR